MKSLTSSVKPPVLQKNPAGLLYLLVIAPVALLLSSILAYSSNLPLLDEWDTAQLIVKLHNGGFTFNDFWMQHNEHRIVLPRLLFLALSSFGTWDVTKQIFANFVVGLLTLIPVWGLLKFTLPDRRLVPLATLLAALLLYSPIQYENWLWGFQLAWFLVNFFAFAAIWALFRRPNSGRSLALAAGITILATFTMASGIPIWPALFAGLLLQWRQWRKRYLAAWLVLWSAAMVAYFYNYHSVSYHPDNFYFLKHPVEFCQYVLSYLGSPLAFWSRSANWSIAISLVSLALLAVMLVWLWRRYGREKGSLWTGLIPWLVVVLFSVFSAIITGIGRAGISQDQSLESRYTSLSTIYWVGWTVIGLVFARQFLAGIRPRRRPFGFLAVAIIAALLLEFYGFSYVKGQLYLESWGTAHRDLIPFLLDYRAASDEALQEIYPIPRVPFLKTWAAPIEQLQEGPFTGSERAKYQALERQKQALISSEGNRALVIPAVSLAPAEGDRPPVEYQGSAIRFQPDEDASARLYADLSTAPGYQGLSGSELSLDLRFEQAWYVRIYWDTGKGINNLEKRLLYPVQGPDGRPHFVAGLPPGTRAFRVAVFYKNDGVEWDSLQASLYRGKVD